MYFDGILNQSCQIVSIMSKLCWQKLLESDIPVQEVGTGGILLSSLFLPFDSILNNSRSNDSDVIFMSETQ
jgi:hypothetical protein